MASVAVLFLTVEGVPEASGGFAPKGYAAQLLGSYS
jgi:hypothetical protein